MAQTHRHLGPLGKNLIKRSSPRVWQIKSGSSNTSCQHSVVKSSFPLTLCPAKLRWIWEEETERLLLTHESLICLWCAHSSHSVIHLKPQNPNSGQVGLSSSGPSPPKAFLLSWLLAYLVHSLRHVLHILFQLFFKVIYFPTITLLEHPPF